MNKQPAPLPQFWSWSIADGIHMTDWTDPHDWTLWAAPTLTDCDLDSDGEARRLQLPYPVVAITSAPRSALVVADMNDVFEAVDRTRPDLLDSITNKVRIILLGVDPTDSEQHLWIDPLSTHSLTDRQLLDAGTYSPTD